MLAHRIACIIMQVIITLDIEDEGVASFWKEFNPEAWATVEAAGMKSVTRCDALLACTGPVPTAPPIAAQGGDVAKKTLVLRSTSCTASGRIRLARASPCHRLGSRARLGNQWAKNLRWPGKRLMCTFPSFTLLCCVRHRLLMRAPCSTLGQGAEPLHNNASPASADLWRGAPLQGNGVRVPGLHLQGADVGPGQAAQPAGGEPHVWRRQLGRGRE